MAICSGRKNPNAYDERDRIEEEINQQNSFWQCLSEPVGIETEFVEYNSPSHATHGLYTTSGSRRTNKTYSSGTNGNFGGASQFPRKNFSRRRI